MKILLISNGIIFLFILNSCNGKSTHSSGLGVSSYELGEYRDTVNKMYNGLKQGKWIEVKDGRRDTVYYENDTIVQ